MSRLYLTLAVVGAVAPYLFFFRFLSEPGATAASFVRDLYATAPAGGFATDLLITSTAFWIWSFVEARRDGMGRWWPYPLLTLAIGLSCAFPAFLWARERGRARASAAARREHDRGRGGGSPAARRQPGAE